MKQETQIPNSPIIPNSSVFIPHGYVRCEKGIEVKGGTY